MLLKTIGNQGLRIEVNATSSVYGVVTVSLSNNSINYERTWTQLGAKRPYPATWDIKVLLINTNPCTEKLPALSRGDNNIQFTTYIRYLGEVLMYNTLRTKVVTS